MTPMTTQQKVKNLSSNGMGAYAISRELGLTPSGVYYHFKVLGIPHRQLNYLKKDQTTHGASKRDSKGRRWPEYDAYTNAKCRCTNPKDRSYHNYGGRGIKFLYTSSSFWILVVALTTPIHWNVWITKEITNREIVVGRLWKNR